MKRVVVLAMLLVVCSNLLAQDWAKVLTDPRLKVGDRIPFTELRNMINYPNKTLKFSDHQAKLIILDFWATNCSPCVEFWPTALELQKKFGKDLMIIPVDSYENSKDVKNFIAKRKKAFGIDMNLPMSSRDTTLWKYFPDRTIPRYVWIGANGVIGATTMSNEVSEQNIKKWITAGPFKVGELVEKQLIGVRPTIPIYVNGNGGNRSSDLFLWTSSLTKGPDDIVAGSYLNADSVSGYYILVTGGGIAQLYGHAYYDRYDDYKFFDFVPKARIEVNAKDTTRYFRTPNGARIYNYQLISGKPKTPAELQVMMQEDLDRYFGLDVKWEKRRKKCVVLEVFDSSLVKGKSLMGDFKMRDKELIIDSLTLRDLRSNLEIASAYRRRNYPIIVENTYKGLITGIRLKTDEDLSNPAVLDKFLSKFGIHVRTEMRETEVLVLRERNMKN
jgi:thiol-disulfide isomerase/thioredoxin